jgi:hypothetical protein
LRPEAGLGIDPTDALAVHDIRDRKRVFARSNRIDLQFASHVVAKTPESVVSVVVIVLQMVIRISLHT